MEHAIKLKSRVLSTNLSDEEFFQFCQEQRDLRIERNAQGEIEIMTPTGSETGSFNGEILWQLINWNKEFNYGKVFDSSAGFTLTNGAVRSPDASWISHLKWDQLSESEKQKFAPVCPEFVIELRSPSDQLSALQEKMEEYMANGCQLGWLIDIQDKKVYMYRQDGSREVLEGFQREIPGENVLPGFSLDLKLLKG